MDTWIDKRASECRGQYFEKTMIKAFMVMFLRVGCIFIIPPVTFGKNLCFDALTALQSFETINEWL
jgi:hypothetical protein